MTPLRFGTTRSFFSVTWLAAASASLVACGDPEKPPAEAAYSIDLLVNQTPAPNTVQCPSEPRIMVPNQLGAPNPTLALTTQTTETQIESMTLLKSGSEGNRISCSISDSGGVFSFSAEIDTQRSSTTTFPQENNLFDVEGTSGAPGTGSLFWLHQGFQFGSATCNFTLATREDGTPFIDETEMKADFRCVPFDNEDGQTCDVRGTFYLTNCN